MSSQPNVRKLIQMHRQIMTGNTELREDMNKNVQGKAVQVVERHELVERHGLVEGHSYWSCTR